MLTQAAPATPLRTQRMPATQNNPQRCHTEQPLLPLLPSRIDFWRLLIHLHSVNAYSFGTSKLRRRCNAALLPPPPPPLCTCFLLQPPTELMARSSSCSMGTLRCRSRSPPCPQSLFPCTLPHSTPLLPPLATQLVALYKLHLKYTEVPPSFPLLLQLREMLGLSGQEAEQIEATVLAEGCCFSI